MHTAASPHVKGSVESLCMFTFLGAAHATIDCVRASREASKVYIQIGNLRFPALRTLVA
jgi:hypothetical protein